MFGSNDVVARLVERAKHLYTLPAVAVKVLDLTNDPDTDAGTLKSCVENDPALTTKILRVVNSSLFGLSRRVSDLNQAITLLGIKPLKLLVLGFSLPERLFVGVTHEVLNRYWRRALTKAVAAREICERYWHTPGDEAFVGGLLSDIGELVLLQDLGEPYAQFLQKVAEEQGDLARLEDSALGFNHGSLSAQLLAAWGLPATLVHVVTTLSNADTLRRLPHGEPALAAQLHLAEVLAQLVAEHRVELLPTLIELGDAYCGIGRADLTPLVQSLGAKVDQLAEVFALDLPTQENYTDVLLEAHRRMAEVAIDAAIELARGARNEEQTCLNLLGEAQGLANAAQEFILRTDRPAQRTHAPRMQAAQSPAGTFGGHNHEAINDETAGGPANDSPIGGLHAINSTAPFETGFAPELLGRLAAAVGRCRERRCELSLLVVAVDRYAELSQVHGQEGAQRCHSLVEATCHALDHAEMTVLPINSGRVALALIDCDRRQAVQIAGDLMLKVRALANAKLPKRSFPTTISVGAATLAAAPKNFQTTMLIESAERCLYAAQASGGNSIKSIEI